MDLDTASGVTRLGPAQARGPQAHEKWCRAVVPPLATLGLREDHRHTLLLAPRASQRGERGDRGARPPCVDPGCREWTLAGTHLPPVSAPPAHQAPRPRTEARILRPSRAFFSPTLPASPCRAAALCRRIPMAATERRGTLIDSY